MNKEEKIKRLLECASDEIEEAIKLSMRSSKNYSATKLMIISNELRKYIIANKLNKNTIENPGVNNET